MREENGLSVAVREELTASEVENINNIVNNASNAQLQIVSYDDKRIDKIISDIAANFQERLTDLSTFEVQETKIGNVADKIHKLGLVTNKVLNDLLGVSTYGKIKKINSHVVEYASPVGVIFGVIPLTNPISNSLFKVLISIKTRNALIVSYPRAAHRVGESTVKIIQNVLQAHGAPSELIQATPQTSTRLQVRFFMSHPGVDLILATGGPDLVKTAYSSGKPAYGVGPGNVPVFIAKSANIVQTAKDIIKGKCYDNGIVCGSESNLIVNDKISSAFIVELENNGAAVLNTEEKNRACEQLFDASTKRLKKNFIGVSGEALAKAADIIRSWPIKIIIIPADMQEILWLSKEKMAPLLTLYSVQDGEGIPLAKQLLDEGIGHTAVIHSQDLEEIERFAEEIPTGRLLVNTPATHGMLGESTHLETSYMLGSGSWGGNITTEAITWRNIVNFKYLAFDREKILPK